MYVEQCNIQAAHLNAKMLCGLAELCQCCLDCVYEYGLQILDFNQTASWGDAL